MRRRLHTQQRGFSLIETWVVILVIGVLAAVAAPKFIGLGTDARIQTLRTMVGSLQALAYQVRTQCMLTPGCDLNAPSAFVNYAGRSRWINYGWPDAGDNLNNNQIDTLVFSNGFDVALINSATTRFSLLLAPTPGQCYVQYLDAYSNSGGSKLYRIDVVTTGC